MLENHPFLLNLEVRRLLSPASLEIENSLFFEVSVGVLQVKELKARALN